MSQQTQAAATTFPIFSILGVLFIGLKLTGFIDWSWWWVLAPFWGPFALLIAVVLICALIAGLCSVALKLMGD